MKSATKERTVKPPHFDLPPLPYAYDVKAVIGELLDWEFAERNLA